MKSSFSRSFSMVATTLLLALTILGASFQYQVNSFLEDTTVSQLHQDAQVVANLASAYGMDNNLTSRELMLNLDIVSQITQADVVICNNQGYIILCSGNLTGCDHDGWQLNQEYLDKVYENNGYSATGTIRNLYSEERYVVSAPIVSGEEHLGIVMVSTPTAGTRVVLDKIGNIRSLRDYYAYWAFEWDAFIVHFGGPFFINELLAQPDTQDVDGTSGSDEAAFFRTTDRNKPHNAYASGEGLQKVIEKKGYSLGYRGLSDENHFRFATKAEPNTLGQYGAKAKDATYIDMSGCYPLTRCYFEFNEDDGLYYRSQHLSGSTDGPHIDAATGEQLTFKNILVQNTFHEELGEGYLAFQCHDTTRDGWFFTNGRGIHVNWEKTSDYSATRYYDDNGDEIILNTGKTMICIIEDGDSFTFH